MFTLRQLPFLCIAFAPAFAIAQHAAIAAEATSASAETKQFDFLLGEWQLEVRPKVSGLAAMIHGTPKLVGTWKAWRVLDGLGIEDELRVVDASGNPLSLTRALRVYAKDAARWQVGSIDAYHGRTSEGSGALRDGELRFEGHGTDAQGKTTLTRTRYFDITPDSFRMLQDRSIDNGQTWDEGVLAIDARRMAASATPG